jgi:hypothetical protein
MVHFPGLAGLVRATDKSNPAGVAACDNASFSMKQTIVPVVQYADMESGAGQVAIKAFEP